MIKKTNHIIGRRPGPGENHGTPATSLFLGHVPYPPAVKANPKPMVEPPAHQAALDHPVTQAIMNSGMPVLAKYPFSFEQGVTRFVRCAMAASRLGRVEMVVYIPSGDAQAMRLPGDWKCRGCNSGIGCRN